jgi:hypothetical protein
MIRAISRALPVTSSATRSSPPRLSQTARAPPAWPRSGPRSEARRPPRSPPRRSRGGRPGAVSHPILLWSTTSRRTGGQTTQTDSCSRHNRAGRRGGHREVGLEAHRARDGLPILRSPRRPLSRSADRRSTAGRQPSGRSFMPRQAPMQLALLAIRSRSWCFDLARIGSAVTTERCRYARSEKAWRRR